MKIALIGFGEVGQTFAGDFLKNAGIVVSTYDILFGSRAGDRLRDRAAAIGVEACDSAAAAAKDADAVISAVTADQCEVVARDAAAFIAPAQFFLDVNSSSPRTKQRAGAAIENAGGSYIEAAVMAPVLEPRLAVPILAGGKRAEEFTAAFNPLGMNITAVATELGRASATKLCRSIVIKGLEALLTDCAAAARHAGVADDVFASLSRSFPSIDWPKLSNNMAERIERHGRRRAAEMREAAAMLDEFGFDGELARAVAARQDRGYRAE